MLTDFKDEDFDNKIKKEDISEDSDVSLMKIKKNGNSKFSFIKIN